MPKSAQPKLAEIQRQMLDTIRQPMVPGQSMRESGGEVANRLIAPNAKLTSFERLEIYNQQYWWRLVSLFAEDFPGVCAVVGQRSFDRLTTEYLEECPSQSWNLRNLGARLPAFLEKYPDLVAPHFALALDVARTEWAVTAAYDEAEEEGIDPQQLAMSDPSTLRLGVQPYLQLLELRYPTDRLLLKLKKRNEAAESVSNAVGQRKKTRAVRITSRPLREPLYLAVHRQDLRVYYRRLDALAYRMLSALRSGETLEAACEVALSVEASDPNEAAGKVRKWFEFFTSFGWLCKRRGGKKQK
jgi:hypothetical protein